jgi:soluble lytic murein transglycosylase-like protein
MISKRPKRDGHPVGKTAAEYLRELDQQNATGPGAWVAGVVLLLALNAIGAGVYTSSRVGAMEEELTASQLITEELTGTLQLQTVETDRLSAIVDYSTAYRIPADLASSVFDIAVAQDLPPELAFKLIETESSFRRHAVSEAGAIGYTQIKPSTARWIDPAVRDADLFNRETNLRLGFTYLRMLLAEYDQDMRLALLAYNRGPGRVQSLLATGADPSNGYAETIMGSAD